MHTKGMEQIGGMQSTPEQNARQLGLMLPSQMFAESWHIALFSEAKRLKLSSGKTSKVH